MIRSLEEILYLLQRNLASALRVALPGRVTSVADDGRVGIQIGVTLPGPDDAAPDDQIPELLGVPVAWPSTTAGAVSLRLAVGDPGLVVFTDVDLGTWLDGVSGASPPSAELHGPSGAVFIPGLAPDAQRPATTTAADAVIEARSGEALEIEGGEVRAGRGAIEAAVLGTTQDAALRTLVAAISAFATSIAGLPGHAGGTALATACTTYLAGSYLGVVTKVK